MDGSDEMYAGILGEKSYGDDSTPVQNKHSHRKKILGMEFGLLGELVRLLKILKFCILIVCYYGWRLCKNKHVFSQQKDKIQRSKQSTKLTLNLSF
jgi:hypothetical protein